MSVKLASMLVSLLDSSHSLCVVGSHDTHVFRLSEPLSTDILLKLDYPINLWQAENGKSRDLFPPYVKVCHIWMERSNRQ